MKNFENFGQTPRSQQVLELFNFQSINQVGLNQLRPMILFFKVHKHLK